MSAPAGGVQIKAGLEGRQGKVTDYYEMPKGKSLGAGTYGTVARVMEKATSESKAMKTIKKAGVVEARLKLELDTMRNMDHPNIIRLYEQFADDKHYYIIMELCSGGELFDRIIDTGAFTEAQAASLMQQMISTVAHCHTRGIMHRDLKPENFLFQSGDKSSEFYNTLKLIDFGLATEFQAGGNPKATKAGTPYYVAPQVLQGKYDEKCDIWSLGVIMYILFCGYPPFYGDSDAEILKKVKKGEFDFPDEDWSSVSTEAKNLIKMMLTMDPAKRPSADQCLAHGWFKHMQDTGNPAAQRKFAKDFEKKLKAFNNKSKFKKMLLTTMATLIPKNKMDQLQAAFNEIDTNHDGKLDYSEIQTAIKSAGGGEVIEYLKNIDIDENGSIEYTEFLACFTEVSSKMAEVVFQSLDKDNSGTLDKNELKEYMSTFYTGKALQAQSSAVKAEIEAEIDALIKEIDQNNDNMIQFDEFKLLFEELQGRNKK